MKKICSECKRELDSSEFYKSKDSQDGLYHHCKKCHQLYNKAWYLKHQEERLVYSREWWKSNPDKTRATAKKCRDKIRDTVIATYGGKCVCCGETHPVFLTIDHVNGGGRKHREAIGGSGTIFYRWLKQNGYPKEFQVLCYNCNSGRWRNGGVCPHKEE